ncbi:hypothetical protein SAMN05216232_3456 [Virgibacillus subterraneus]|uniref:HTH merR-type domain-containing protein n=2 Tax=Virgibacillus TaxID=84406 RepID=A0A1H1GCG7_9BACI|nr:MULTISPECIES: hypothetical protein [Virgibacillus]SDR10972.1 hypothetical protein SAMN05216231_3643 [Virgibacillus salinus]SEQ83565.1 hypothetical protein SAMN05216232_3456 [Virgibacillus subterraneus]
MRHDIQPNERSYTTKEVADELGIATPTVRKYGQVLERNGYEFFKDGDRRIFVRSDIESLIAIRDTDKPLDVTATYLVNQQKLRLEGFNETEITISDTTDNSPQDLNQLKESLMFLANELAATREMNVQLTNDMSQLKTTVSQLQQDHHVISSGIGNSAQKTARIEKLTEQQNSHYESLLQQEKEKSEFLQKEIQNMRDEQKKEWRLQSDFNKRLEKSMTKPKGTLDRFLSIFRK